MARCRGEQQMINYIFKTKESLNASPNDFLPIIELYNTESKSNVIGVFAKTNVFIGENNSGKSMFLRSLFQDDSKTLYSLTDTALRKIIQNLSALYGIATVGLKNLPDNINKFSYLAGKLKDERAQYSNIPNRFFGALREDCSTIDYQKRFYFPVIRGVKNYKQVINNKLVGFREQLKEIQNKDTINHFIDSLGYKSSGLDDLDIYQEVISNEHFMAATSLKGRILTGGKLYYEIKSMLLGKEEQREIITEFQDFLRTTFFSEHKDILLTPMETEKVLYLKIGNEERPIHKWGDGIQQLIIILYSLYKHKKEENLLFFIEEPELYMHPGILRKFVEVINSDTFKNHQYFITTHSNIILDVSADSGVDMSIFKFKKVKNKATNGGKPFLIEQCNNGDESLLNELGVRNSSVFLSNCSIWIEGITDRLYIKHFLKLYNKKFQDKKIFRENLDFTFIEYAGGNLPHFNFDANQKNSDLINSRFINNKIFLVTDNDNCKAGSKKAERKELLKANLKDNYYDLAVLEIENLISAVVLLELLKKQNPKEITIIESSTNKLINYKDKKLGLFIDSIFRDTNVRKYATNSGTINNKLQFCNSAIEQTLDYDSLTDEAKALTEKVYAFILNNNKN